MFQISQHGLHIGHFLISDKNKGVFKFNFLSFLIGDEIRRDKPSIKFHAFHKLDLVTQSFSVLHSNGSMFSHFFHQLGQQITDLLIPIG